MPILVDTNVISDVIHRDPVWEPWSAAKLIEHAGVLHVNALVFAELSCRATSTQEVECIIDSLGLHYQELSPQALFLTAQAFLRYRRSGGNKTSPLPDFFIGAHAQAEGHAILTRDKDRYQTYFPTVPLITPP